MDAETQYDEPLQLRVEFTFPEGTRTQFADRILVQHTEHEFLVSFFETEQPVLLGPPEENRERLRSLGSVKAHCVARVAVAAGRMPELVEVLTENLRGYREHYQGGQQ